jgi:hypothetical protein
MEIEGYKTMEGKAIQRNKKKAEVDKTRINKVNNKLLDRERSPINHKPTISQLRRYG